jgi:hypothetical protein
VNFIWATHVVHHQSEEYNLTTALRQSMFQGLMSAPFYLPLAVMGFPPLMMLLAVTANTLYQFWIHTRLVDRLGPLEWVLNTPSHHRVHHGIDPQYVDKNYAGVLIVWDRLFGTFAPEKEPVHYGTVKPLKSWNPVWANLAGWKDIWDLSRQGKTWRERLYAWVAPPEWRPAHLGGVIEIPTVTKARVKFEPKPYRGMPLYIVSQFTVVLVVAVVMLLLQDELPLGISAFVVGWILASLVAWGALNERKPWGVALEFVRQGAFLLVVAFLLPAGVPVVLPQVAAGLFAALSLFGLRALLRKQ